MVTDGEAIIGDERYELVLRARPSASPAPKRYVYAFVIDSSGKSTLLFPPPNSGSVGNHIEPSLHDTEIPLGEDSAFSTGPPYGIDTYFLLSTDDPLPNPSILEWDGVRAPEAHSPLEQLLLQPTRALGVAVPTKWSITKTTFESLAPHTTKAAQ